MLLAALTGTMPVAGTARPAPTFPRSNVVVLLADDWGFSDVGSFGS